MIVKLQKCLDDESMPMMVYNQSHSFFSMLDVTPRLLDLLDGEAKRYFKAELIDGTLCFVEPVEPQPW